MSPSDPITISKKEFETLFLNIAKQSANATKEFTEITAPIITSVTELIAVIASEKLAGNDTTSLELSLKSRYMDVRSIGATLIAIELEKAADTALKILQTVASVFSGHIGFAIAQAAGKIANEIETSHTAG